MNNKLKIIRDSIIYAVGTVILGQFIIAVFFNDGVIRRPYWTLIFPIVFLFLFNFWWLTRKKKSKKNINPA
jgi:hypothetical protein